MVLALLAGNLPAWPFAIAFLILALVFSNTARGRVPLYLTNRETASVLKRMMKERGAISFTEIATQHRANNIANPTTNPLLADAEARTKRQG